MPTSMNLFGLLGGDLLRIVYLVNSKWPTIRGAERLLLSLCAHAKAQGHDVSVLAPEASAMHRACRDAGVRSLDAEFSPSPFKVWHLRTVLRELDPDIVHGMSIFPVALIRRLRLLPVDGSVGFFAYASIDPTSSLPVATAHFRGLLLRVRNAISRREAPRLDAIFAASETISQRLSVVGIRGHIVAIPGVVDVERLETDSQLPLPLPGGSPRIGYAAIPRGAQGHRRSGHGFRSSGRGTPISIAAGCGRRTRAGASDRPGAESRRGRSRASSRPR